MKSLLAALAATAALLAACASPAQQPAAPDPLEFTLPTADGGTLAGSSLRGTPTVLWFWAPWCVICRAKAPEIARHASRYAGKVTVIGVAGHGRPAEIRRFIEQTGVERLTHAIDTEGAVWTAFGITSQPAFVFLDRTGKTEVFTGSLPAADLTARMDALAS